MDLYRDGKFVREIRGNKVKIGGDIIMGLDPAVGLPDRGIYPRVNLPTPDHNPITQRLKASYALVDGKSERTLTVEDRPDAAERQAAYDAAQARAAADKDVADDLIGDAVVELLDGGTAQEIKDRIVQAIPDDPATNSIRTVITKIALALADTRRKT